MDKDERLERITAAIVAKGTEFSAADVFEAFAELADLSAKARVEMNKVQTGYSSVLLTA